MGKEPNWEHHPGVSPIEKAEREHAKGKKVDWNQAVEGTIKGLEQAIESTKNRIAEYKLSGASTTDLEVHLRKLEEQMKTYSEETDLEKAA